MGLFIVDDLARAGNFFLARWDAHGIYLIKLNGRPLIKNIRSTALFVYISIALLLK